MTGAYLSGLREAERILASLEADPPTPTPQLDPGGNNPATTESQVAQATDLANDSSVQTCKPEPASNSAPQDAAESMSGASKTPTKSGPGRKRLSLSGKRGRKKATDKTPVENGGHALVKTEDTNSMVEQLATDIANGVAEAESLDATASKGDKLTCTGKVGDSTKAIKTRRKRSSTGNADSQCKVNNEDLTEVTSNSHNDSKPQTESSDTKPMVAHSEGDMDTSSDTLVPESEDLGSRSDPEGHQAQSPSAKKAAKRAVMIDLSDTETNHSDAKILKK